MNWLKSTFCIVCLNADSDAKLTDGGNPLWDTKVADRSVSVPVTLSDLDPYT